MDKSLPGPKHTHTHTRREALWPVCLHCKSFYIIINQFDTFTSALKRKPQGFREVLHKSFMNCKGSGAGTGEGARERWREIKIAIELEDPQTISHYATDSHFTCPTSDSCKSSWGRTCQRTVEARIGERERKQEGRGAPHQCANVRLITHHQS